MPGRWRAKPVTETAAEFTACRQEHRMWPDATADGTRAIRTVHGTSPFIGLVPGLRRLQAW